MSNNSIMMRDIQKAREAIVKATQKHESAVILTPGEFRAMCAGFVALERQVQILQNDNRQLIDQINAMGNIN